MRIRLLPYAVLGILALSGIALGSTILEPGAAGTRSLYAQGTTKVQTYSPSFTPIPGMQLTLPAKASSAAYALVTFDAPNVSMDGSQCSFAISAGANAAASGQTARILAGFAAPLTIVARVPLLASTQALNVNWASSAKQSLCQLTTFYSLSAILTI